MDSCDSRPTSSGPPTTSSAPQPSGAPLAQYGHSLEAPGGQKHNLPLMGSSDSPCGLLEVSCWFRKAFLQRVQSRCHIGRAVRYALTFAVLVIRSAPWLTSSSPDEGGDPGNMIDRLNPRIKEISRNRRSHNSEDSSTLERAPYIQHSLVISKLPYLPPHAQLRIAIDGTYASARLCAPP